MQLYLPQGQYRDFIMKECHDSRYAGHLGMKKTEELVPKRLLLANPASGCDLLRTDMRGVSTQQSIKSTISGVVAAIRGPQSALGKDQYGFHHTSPEDQIWF